MLAELAPLTVNHPGLAAHLKDVAEQFGAELEVEADNAYAVFFEEVDLVDNWQAATEDLQNSITAVVEPWANENPLIVVQRLLSLRMELKLANVKWPELGLDGMQRASDRTANPLAWADIALEHGLFPEASPFVDGAVARAVELGQERLARFLSAPGLGGRLCRRSSKQLILPRLRSAFNSCHSSRLSNIPNPISQRRSGSGPNHRSVN